MLKSKKEKPAKDEIVTTAIMQVIFFASIVTIVLHLVASLFSDTTLDWWIILNIGLLFYSSYKLIKQKSES